MTKDDEKQYRAIHQETLNAVFSRASVIAGQAVKKGVKYKLACDAIYAAHYQALFGSALKKLQNEGKIPTGISVNEAWVHREIHELLVHEIAAKAFSYLDALDERYFWSMNILKKNKKK